MKPIIATIIGLWLAAIAFGDEFKRFEVTGYCPCSICCGKYASGGMTRRTASGKRLCEVAPFGFVAGPKSMPFGTRLSVPGYKSGRVVRCEDRGGAIREGRLDLYFSTHREALIWGRRTVTVRIIQGGAR